ncbi:uncharacterized protein METZ01_LOCUS375401, partial [marine metagenome]
MKIKHSVIIYAILLLPIFSKAEIQYSHSGYFDLGT